MTRYSPPTPKRSKSGPPQTRTERSLSETDEPEYELVMPFLPVASRGGPYDDAAFASGFAMGGLWAHLEGVRPEFYEMPVQVENREQADLIAMKYGYSATFGEPLDGWVHMALTRTSEVSLD